MSATSVTDERDERSLFGLIRHTPMRDLLRGRLSGRLDTARLLAERDLPEPVTRLVLEVTRRSRLWRLEKIDVADELAGHFVEGLAAGQPGEALVSSFGDPAAAARLIRRAKRRQRPTAWKAARWTTLGVFALIALYVLFGVRLLLSRPAPSVDYLARVNAAAAAVPEPERAWPLYRAALLALVPADFLKNYNRAPRPGEIGWDEALAHVDANASAIELARRGAARPGLGFVAHLQVDDADATLWPEEHAANVQAEGPLLYAARIPHLAEIKKLATLLALDARRAAAADRGDIVLANIAAISRMADHVREIPFIINDLVAFSLVGLATRVSADVVAAHAEALSDEQLLELAHHLATVDDTLVARFEGERMGFADLLQHVYTDGRDGDGHLTWQGLRLYTQFASMANAERPETTLGTALALPLLDAIDVGRKEMMETFDRLIGAHERDAMRPRWAWGDDEVDRQLETWASSPLDSAHYFPIVLLMPALGKVRERAEAARAYRDGVHVAIALELHRRRHGSWPADLDVLVPQMLPEVPRDRVDGDPVRYALIDGAPVVYSVGTDTDDDDGTPVIARSGNRNRDAAAGWWSPARLAAARADPDVRQPPDGDWILWPRASEPITRFP